MTYTDGTMAVFSQSISDWTQPQGFAGESIALATSYRDTATGQYQGGGFLLYEYSFPLNPTKQVRSLTLPMNPNVEVFAASLGASTSIGPQQPTSPRLLRRQQYLARLAQIRQMRQARLQQYQARLAQMRQARLQQYQARLAQIRGLVTTQAQGRSYVPSASLAFDLIHRRRV